MHLRALTSLSFACTLAACVAAPQTLTCAGGMTPRQSALLYFGTDSPAGTVTPDQWAAFLERVVTPQFPNGLSVWQAAGQWRAPGGAIVREGTYVLNVVHGGNAADERAFAAIIAAYKQQFQQSSVLRVQTEVCTNLGEEDAP